MLTAVLLFSVAILGSGLLIFLYNDLMYPLKYKNEIISASNEFGVNSSIIASIINAESRFNSKAVSNKGAVGLMQLLPTTAEWSIKRLSGVQNNAPDCTMQQTLYDSSTNSGELFDPNTNIRVGTYYFAYLLKKFTNLETAICAYNAGEGTIKTWLNNQDISADGVTLKKIPYRETRDYLSKVLRNIKVYENKIKNTK